MTYPKKCMLEENKLCDNCLECNACELDPGKICNSCAKCIKDGLDKAIIFEEFVHDHRLVSRALLSKARRNRKVVYYKAR